MLYMGAMALGSSGSPMAAAKSMTASNSPLVRIHSLTVARMLAFPWLVGVMVPP